MLRNVKVLGLNELKPKLRYEVLVQPEMNDAMETFGARIERQGKGLGAKRNTLMRATKPLGLTVDSTLNYPRTTGVSWGRKNEGIVKGMASRVLKKTVERIRLRWGK